MPARAQAVGLAVVCACGLSCTAPPRPAAPPSGPVCAQAMPVHDWFRAVKTLDARALERVFSARLRDEFAKEGWDNTLSRYVAVWSEQLGPYELNDFSYTFQGDADTGTVHTLFRGRALPPVQVVREGDAWKVDER